MSAGSDLCPLTWASCLQDLWIPYFNITTDITASAMRVHTDGRGAFMSPALVLLAPRPSPRVVVVVVETVEVFTDCVCPLEVLCGGTSAPACLCLGTFLLCVTPKMDTC